MFCMIYVKHQARDKNKLLKLFSIFDLQYIKYDWKYVYSDGKKSLQNRILEAAVNDKMVQTRVNSENDLGACLGYSWGHT